jgi:uncharacterized membrane protein YjfL (UPF0719 family)
MAETGRLLRLDPLRVIGVLVFWISFVIVDKVTPYDLWDEICEKKNVALAIVVGSMAIAIGLIVAAAIHGDAARP